MSPGRTTTPASWCATSARTDGTAGELGHGRLVGHIGGHSQGLATGRLTFTCQLFQGIGPACGHHHPRPQLAETLNRKAGETSRTRRVKEDGN